MSERRWNCLESDVAQYEAEREFECAVARDLYDKVEMHYVEIEKWSAHERHLSKGAW